MSAHFYSQQQQLQQQQHTGTAFHMSNSSNHHGARSRRGPKSSSQSSQRQFRGVKSMRDLAETPAATAFRARFEAGRSFDLDDDMEFCPNLLTEDDLHSIHSASSDRSSLASGSPDSSPLQHQIQPVQQVPPAVSLSPSSTNAYMNPAMSNAVSQMAFQQPSAVRTRKVIPIVNPHTGMTLSSPPNSISPNLMQNTQRRW